MTGLGLWPGVCPTAPVFLSPALDCSRVLEELLLLGKGPHIQDPPFLLLHLSLGALQPHTPGPTLSQKGQPCENPGPGSLFLTTPHLPSGLGLRIGEQQWEPQSREGALPLCGPLACFSPCSPPHFLCSGIQMPLPSDSVPLLCPLAFLSFCVSVPLQQNQS